MQSKIIIRNAFDRKLILYLEPWGEDYTMLPEEEFEILARGIGEEFYFHVEAGKDVLVWVEGQCENVGVYHKVELLRCGHNRVE